MAKSNNRFWGLGIGFVAVSLFSIQLGCATPGASPPPQPPVLQGLLPYQSNYPQPGYPANPYVNQGNAGQQPVQGFMPQANPYALRGPGQFTTGTT